MTDRHDSPPLTRRELRERERVNALAGRDPSWQAPAEGPREEKVEPADKPHDVPATAGAPSTGDEKLFEPKAESAGSEPHTPPVVPADTPITSYSEYQKPPTPLRAQPEADSPFAPMVQTPHSAPQQPTDDAEHTMTRRQLREFRAAQGLTAPGPEASEPSTELLADEPLRSTGPGDPQADDPTAEPVSAEPEWRAPELPATEFLDQISPTSEPVSPVAAKPESDKSESDKSESDQSEPDAVASTDEPHEFYASDQLATEDPDGSHTRSFRPPTGHWSIAAKEEQQPSFEDIIAGPADTSGSGLGSSTLVLSSVPTRDSAWSAMGKSGEPLKTGSLELPAGLSSTGEHARFDTSALDRMFDEEEVGVDTAMVHSPGSEPVRASSAVSSLTPTGDIVGQAGKTSHRLPMALAISAGALAVGVVGLFAAGAILGLF